ncbi:MAG TPA: alginate export family protein [Puia sp.]|nr:alginate export family protein [Puia sp.]
MRKNALFTNILGLGLLFGSPFRGLTQSGQSLQSGPPAQPAQFSIPGQLSITGQLRTRTEFRNGYGTLETTGNKPAFLTSQRTRLIFNYKTGRVIFQASLQDVRVWGADASSISNADGSRLGLHEAWAEIILANAKDSSFSKSAFDYLSVKIGRQELVYDDQRLLGNLDWLQQGRRHDAIVFKLLHKGWQADLGAAFNQNTDAAGYNGTYYTPANIPAYVKDSKGNLVPTPAGLVPLTNTAGISTKTGAPFLTNPPGTNGMNQEYKAMQFLYIAKKFNQTKISGLLLTDQFGKYISDSVRDIAGTDTGYVYGRRFNQPGVNTRFTTGILVVSQLDKQKNWTLNAGFYYQGGKDKDGLTLSAYTSTLSLNYTKKTFSATTGWDYVSGNNSFSSSTTNHRFDPLYGTPHKFWGIMDYFYAGTGSATGGLNNPFLKVKYTSTGSRFNIGLDYHYLALAGEQKDTKGNHVDKYLGSEFDLVTNYNLNKITSLEGGFCWLAATRSMEYAKGITPGTARLNANWAYLQINIRPEFFSK